jgi:regulation of enolase protein 1 (concanavalin A-like superfamily)
MSVASFSWLNEPPTWRFENGELRLRTGRETDFWRETFYGFTRDSGHAWLQPVSGDFTAEVTVRGDYQTLYDQAGLMLRLDAANWIKAGIEYTDGMMHFSVVVTHDVSDWSVIPLPHAKPSDEIKVRLTRHDDAVRVQFSVAGSPWQMARLCPFTPGDARVGMMACSPQRAGFEASFAGFAVGPAISRELHAEEE